MVGSLNLDLVVRCERIPAVGETVEGGAFQMLPGGKGANQAYAAARLSRGGGVAMIGKVGDDAFGVTLKGNLESVGVDVSGVVVERGVATGVAMIEVDATGQNSIVVAGGANQQWQPRDVDALADVLDEAALVLFQLETPLWVVERFARLAKQAGAVTILDPAPARELPAEVLMWMDYVTPNETEAWVVSGDKVIEKLGARGSRYRDVVVPAIAVEAVDTTAAGDTYNAGLAVGLSEGMGIVEAMRFATVAAGLSVTKVGAQSSAPSRDEVDEVRW